MGGSDTGPDSSFLSAGWFNEYVTAVGIGAGPRELAPASTRGAEESVYLEQRPTKAQVSGKKATRERISAAEDLFNFEEFGDSSESDDWEWFL